MPETQRPIADQLEERTRAFEQRFLRVATGGLAIAMLFVIAGGIASGPQLLPMLSMGGAALVWSAAFGLTWSPWRRASALVFLFGTSLPAGLALMGDPLGNVGQGAIQAMLIIVVLAPFFVSRYEVAGLLVVDALLLSAAYLKLGIVDGHPIGEVVSPILGTSLLLVVSALAIGLFVRHAAETQSALRQRLRDIDVVMDRARRISTGDLSGEVQGESDVSHVIGSMLGGLRGLVEQIQGNASRLASASSEIAAMAQQQEQSAIEQGGAIEETRRTVGSLLDASRQIAVSARGVTENAEATLKNAEVIADRIRTLTEHAQRITEVLELIRDVANKSELLALNAALEGAKAGDAGRGFSLVASQMQRLAESVMESVKLVKELTADIRKATNATALATEDATKLAADTTEAARRIGVITEQQEGSTEQVTRAIDEIAGATHQSAAGTNQTLQAVRELSQIAERLNQYASQFQL